MLDAAKVPEQIKKTLESDGDLVKKGVRVSRSEYINMDPDMAPWVGVYKSEVKMAPRAMGVHGSSWKATVVVKLIVQEADLMSGEACEDKLDDLVKDVLDAVWSDPQLAGTVDMVTDLDIQYRFSETDRETIYFQWAFVTVTMEVATG